MGCQLSRRRLSALVAGEPSEVSARVQAVRALGQADDVPALLRALEDDEARVRAAAAEALGAAGPQLGACPALVAALCGGLADRPGQELLLQIAPAPAAVRGLIAAFGDADKGVRAAAARALGCVQPAQDAVPSLVAALADRDWTVRRRAAEALARVGPAKPLAVPALILCLNGEDARVRRGAVAALKLIGPAAAEAVPALTEAAAGSDTSLWTCAAEALEVITAPFAPERLASPVYARLLAALERVLRGTCHAEGACARARQLRVLDVQLCRTQRLEDSYAATREALRQRLPVCPKLAPEPLVSANAPGLAEAALLDGDLNEALLFHGTSWQGFSKIFEDGFSEAASRESCLYGQGCYFTDQACKAAQYAPLSEGGCRVLIIARVLLGKVFLTRTGLPHAREAPEACDSVVAVPGVANEGRQVHREYVVYSGRQAKPELAVLFT